MLVVSIAIQKGGSGKTTTAINLAAALVQFGKSVLLIDLDPQANLSQSLGVEEDSGPSLYTSLKKAAFGEPTDLLDILVQTGGLDLIPAGLDLADADLELVSVYGREKVLSSLIAPLRDSYDYILIDCPPSIGMLTVNALTASDWVLLPLQAEFLPLKGLQSFLRTFQGLKKQVNPDVEILGILLTQYDRRKKMHNKVSEGLADEYPDWLFDTRIRSNIALATAQERGVDIYAYDATCNGALDYLRLAREFLDKLG